MPTNGILSSSIDLICSSFLLQYGFISPAGCFSLIFIIKASSTCLRFSGNETTSEFRFNLSFKSSSIRVSVDLIFQLCEYVMLCNVFELQGFTVNLSFPLLASHVRFLSSPQPRFPEQTASIFR